MNCALVLETDVLGVSGAVGLEPRRLRTRAFGFFGLTLSRAVSVHAFAFVGLFSLIQHCIRSPELSICIFVRRIVLVHLTCT